MEEAVTDRRRGRGLAEALDCEITLTGDDQAMLAVAGRQFIGRPNLGQELKRELCKHLLEPRAYGSRLFKAVFPDGDELLAGYQEALALARHERRRLRLRLNIAPAAQEQLQELRWELLWDPRENIALSRSRSTTFSRYLSVPLAPGTEVVRRPRILVVLSAPNDLEAYGLAKIDGEAMRRAAAATSRSLGPQIDHEILDGPATLVRLRDRLVAGEFHVLHFLGHGGIEAGHRVAHLVLESSEGRAEFVEEPVFAEIFEGDRNLRLVTLMACHGGPRGGTDPFAGLAPSLVRRGVPAVVAMGGALPFDVAARFSDHLYDHLGRWGQVDAAVNEARQRLHLEAPERPEWSLPMLYMRLEDGLLWRGTEATPATTSEDLMRQIVQARSAGDGEGLKAIEDRLGSLEETSEDLAMELFLAYRAISGWVDMVRLFDHLPSTLRQRVKVRQQLAFALNRQGEHQQAIWILEKLLREAGPSHETCGILGRVYKDLWQKARSQERDALSVGYLDKAIATYIQGFEIDWRDGYAGINALTLLDIKGDDASLERQAELLPLVRFAVKQRLKADQPDYWDHATLLELAILAADAVAARQACADALAVLQEPWQAASTASNIRMIRDSRCQRGVREPWLDQLLEELSMPPLDPL
ncbi:MAG: TRAFs-binding domain-containing protein [Acidobacteriota bacterium]